MPNTPSTKRRGKATRADRTIRRSIAVPANLIQEALAAAGAEAQGNLNKVVKIALRAFVEECRRAAFGEEMARMAADPHVRRESAALERAFRVTESDGL